MLQVSMLLLKTLLFIELLDKIVCVVGTFHWGRLQSLMTCTSAQVSTGCSKYNLLHWLGPGSNKFPSGPIGQACRENITGQ